MKPSTRRPATFALPLVAALPAALLMMPGAAVAAPIAATSAAAAVAGTQADFDGDGFADLAIVRHLEVRDPGSEEGYIGAKVTVLYGSASGTSSARAQVWQASGTGPNAYLGRALATGDVDGDGYDDLVASSRYDSISVIYGSASGLTSTGREELDAQDFGLPGTDDLTEIFADLAVADFDADGHADIAAGIKPRGSYYGGGFAVVYGSATGVNTARHRIITQNTTGVPGKVESADDFGATLAAGDVDGDGRADLAVGAPNESVGAEAAAGAVWLFRGSGTGLSTTAVTSWEQGTGTVPGSSEAGDEFGDSLAMGDVDGDGRDDLAVGVPGEDWTRHTPDGDKAVRSGGTVVVLMTNGGAFGSASTHLSQSSPGVIGTGESGDRCATVAFGDVDGDGSGDLAIGCPGETVAAQKDGAVLLVPNGPGGLDPAGSTFWQADAKGVAGPSQVYLTLGVDVVFRDGDGDGDADLYAGSANGVLQLPAEPSGLTATGSTFWVPGVDGVPAGGTGLNFGLVLG